MQAWEEPAATGTRGTASARRPAAPTPPNAVAANDDDDVRRAIAQLGRALDAAAASGGLLPKSDRLTMHQRQADGAERQLLLLRRLRQVEPRAPTLTEAQLAEVLRPFGRAAAPARPGSARAPMAAASASAVTFLEPRIALVLGKEKLNFEG